MRLKLFLLFFLCHALLVAQISDLAQNYFDQGAYHKALPLYQKLVAQSPLQPDYIVGLAKTYQQLEDYASAQSLLEEKLSGKRIYPLYYIELGYNFSLQKQDEQAQVYYQKAIDFALEEPNYSLSLGRRFTDYVLLPQAQALYEKVMRAYPDKNFILPLARVYGELGLLDLMFDAYIQLMASNASYIPTIKRYFASYVTEDPKSLGNLSLKKALLQKLRGTPNVLYNELLSWLFAQQQDYQKAFIQEKAIFSRAPGSVQGFFNLALAALDQNRLDVAYEIFEHVLEVAPKTDDRLEATRQILLIEQRRESKDLQAIEEHYRTSIEAFGIAAQSTDIRIDYARFLAFDRQAPQKARKDLLNYLEVMTNPYAIGRVRLVLGDILVYEERFNEALITYAQVQSALKNDVLAQEARFRGAQTSYFKGDFDWAQTQLKVLKSASTQKMANDALALNLLISDNTVEDSTQTGLKAFAHADLLQHQKRTSAAIVAFKDLLAIQQDTRLEDDILFKLAALYQEMGQNNLAQSSLETLLDRDPDSVLADDAHFALAKLLEGPLSLVQEAMSHYENIIFNHTNSIYFVEAQQRYRALRGDAPN